MLASTLHENAKSPLDALIVLEGRLTQGESHVCSFSGPRLLARLPLVSFSVPTPVALLGYRKFSLRFEHIRILQEHLHRTQKAIPRNTANVPFDG